MSNGPTLIFKLQIETFKLQKILRLLLLESLQIVFGQFEICNFKFSILIQADSAYKVMHQKVLFKQRVFRESFAITSLWWRTGGESSNERLSSDSPVTCQRKNFQAKDFPTNFPAGRLSRGSLIDFESIDRLVPARQSTFQHSLALETSTLNKWLERFELVTRTTWTSHSKRLEQVTCCFKVWKFQTWIRLHSSPLRHFK